jgi:hypothetical protein
MVAAAKNTIITFPTLYPHMGNGEMPNGMPPSGSGQYIRLAAAAKSVFDGTNFVPFDSTTYTYSSGRGGLLDMDYTDLFSNFDYSIYYEYDVANNVYNNAGKCLQTFTAAGTVQYRTQQKWMASDAQWQNSFRYEYLYSEGFQRLLQTNVQVWNGSWNGNSLNYKIDYDFNGNIVKVNMVTSILYLSYDANNNITERKEYSYQAGNWNYTDKYTFSYNTANQLTGYVLQHYTNDSWVNAEKKDYIISNNNVAAIVTATWSSNTWIPSYQNLFSYDVNGNKLSNEYQVWDNNTATYKNQRKENWSYNTDNQPITYSSQTWSETNAAWQAVKGDFFHHYYYEKYFPTDVLTLNESQDFLLYPQPANDQVNITIKNAKASTTSVYIYDMQGKTVKTFSTTQTHQTIPISDLPAGQYWVNIVSADKKRAQPLTVVH